ncbi:phosphoribulokinase/uridine kinase [Bisporella sp. PMI_857]|nr:phosphoribulokinase/uridine kinase [Bisporella sp. PMI_857]
METPEQILCNRLETLLHRNSSRLTRRIIVAMAGPPGSGKSTIAKGVMKLFNGRNHEQLQIIPMDGFHYNKARLSTLQSPECPFRRRGAPFTIDAESFVDLVKELKNNPVTDIDKPVQGAWAPTFDHAKKDPVEQDLYIPSSQRVILLEGNYLLLNESPWSQVQRMVDETWFIKVSRETAKRRLIVRHIETGIEDDWDAAAERAETNDLLNLDLIMTKMGTPDVVIDNCQSRSELEMVST